MPTLHVAERWKQKLWNIVDERRPLWVELLREAIRRPTDNPPGTTTELASFYRINLERQNIRVEVLEPKAGCPNIIASIVGGENGRHLILNGHMDQLPVERLEQWTVQPYSGEIKDGRIYGRGAADMKAGSTALAIVMMLLAEMKVPLAGRATLALVSDEVTGGKWGTGWLLENRPELIGDAVIDAEPGSLEAVHLAEKGICQIRIITHSPGGFSPRSSMDNAIYKMCTAIRAGLKLRGKKVTPLPVVSEIIANSQAIPEKIPGLEGTNWVFDSITLGVGTIRGGIKVNVVPQRCEAEFDFRIPFGFTQEQLIGEFKEALRSEGLSEKDVSIDPVLLGSPNYTNPKEEIVQILFNNVKAITGREPVFRVAAGSTDCRYWRFKGIPAAVVGPRQYNVGAPDENIVLDDYIMTIKAHIAAVVDFLGLIKS
jgi:succinyl-diaminopimelate desuccinylase